MRKQIRFTLLLLGITFGYLKGQNFTPISVNNAQGVYNGECFWFDFDNDNDLDFIITGQSNINDLHTKIYRNNGSDSFELFMTLPGYSETGLELINANGDDLIDLLINGRKIGGGNNPTSIYINNLNGFQLEASAIDFRLSGSSPSVIFKDWNNDLREDIIISGINGYVEGNPSIETIFYSKNQNGDFTKSSPINGGAYSSGAKFFDVDNDLDLDYIISGNSGEFPFQKTQLYLNEGNNFVLSDNALLGLQNSAIDIGDYNSDGYMDVILTGYNEFLRDTTILYKNVEGNLTGVLNSGLNGHVSGSVQWGDYDNDGDLDLLFNGESSGDWPFEIMINDGDDRFTHLTEDNFKNLSNGSAAWGDYDNDGDLDIVVTGFEEPNNPELIIYRNDITASNTAPSTPGNLAVNSFELKNVDISWDASSDVETPAGSLTYNLHVEDLESNIVFSSFADLQSGHLRRVWHGNVGNSTTWEFKNLIDGTYKAYVQAIDAGFNSSAFSDSSIFYIGIPTAATNLSLEESNGLKLNWEDRSNNEQFFVIERKLNENDSFLKLDSVKSDITTFVDEKLPPSFAVNYRIQATNPNAPSEYTNTVTYNFDATPTNLSASLSSAGVQLSWVDNSFNEEYFIIERKLAGSNSFIKIDSVNANVTEFIDDENIFDEITYRVYAKNEFGISEYSTETTVIIANVNSEYINDMEVYPNPFTDSFFIEMKSSKIEGRQIQIFNAEGKSVEFSVELQDLDSLKIRLKDNSTMYFLTIKNGTDLFSFKLLKE